MNNQTVLRTENNGVEFFTVVATGESGMSQSGLARACGITQQSLSELVAKLNPITKAPSKTLEPSTAKGFNPTGKASKALTGKASSKWLQPFTGKDLTLTGNYSDSDLKSRNVTIYTAEFCAAVIQHYAFKGNETAQDTLSATAEIGLTSYIQSITGWLPEQYKAAPEAHKKLDQFLSLAHEWESNRIVVDEDGYEIDMSESWTFLEEVLLAGFTPDELITYEDENRQLGLDSHGASKKFKLFFERHPKTEERLKPYTDNVERLLTQSKNPHSFYRDFKRAYGDDPTTLFERLLKLAREYRTGYKLILESLML